MFLYTFLYNTFKFCKICAGLRKDAFKYCKNVRTYKIVHDCFMAMFTSLKRLAVHIVYIHSLSCLMRMAKFEQHDSPTFRFCKQYKIYYQLPDNLLIFPTAMCPGCILSVWGLLRFIYGEYKIVSRFGQGRH